MQNRREARLDTKNMRCCKVYMGVNVSSTVVAFYRWRIDQELCSLIVNIFELYR